MDTAKERTVIPRLRILCSTNVSRNHHTRIFRTMTRIVMTVCFFSILPTNSDILLFLSIISALSFCKRGLRLYLLICILYYDYRIIETPISNFKYRYFLILAFCFRQISLLYGDSPSYLCHALAQQPHIFATVNLKTEVIMWIAVIISVFLSVEVLSYISGGGWKAENSKK